MSTIQKKIELFSNIAIIVVAILVSSSFLLSYFSGGSSKTPQPEPGISLTGTKLPLDGIDWSKKGKTIVLALSANCRYCNESVDFYRTIADKRADRNDIGLVGVMPQDIGDARTYFTDRNLGVDEVRSLNLSNIRVKGTPTLIVVDRDGSVVESWVGRLTPEKEEEVIRRVFGQVSGN
jgi:thioredoxin-related protein